MIKEQHPVTLSLRLVNQWLEDWNQEPEGTPLFYVARRAVQWGADQELNECCGWIAERLPHHLTIDKLLRNDRRPKTPSLKEQAMQALNRFMASDGHDDCSDEGITDDFNLIRRALESLPND